MATTFACAASMPGRATDAAGTAIGAAATRRRVDPRAAMGIVLLLNATAFLTTSVPLEAAAMGGCAAAMCWSGRGASAVRWLAAYAVLLVLSTAFVAGGGVLAPFGVTLVMIRRVLCIGAFASNMIATTRAGELACALQRIRVPRKMVCALCVMLRFFPTLGQEFRRVLDAMKVRGRALTPARALRHPAQVLENVLVPVVGRVGIVADELANAAVVRGIDSEMPRTSYFGLRLQPSDALFGAYFLALAVVAVACRLGAVA